MKTKKILIIMMIVAMLFSILSGCSSSSTDGSHVEDSKGFIEEDKSNNANDNEQSENNAIEEDSNKDNTLIENQIDLDKVKPNENGKIMILMYHGIAENEQEWVRTPDNFRKDLKALYDNGYRLISLRDYVENNIKVEAGYTPVIITFDDGLQNQFNIIEENGNKKIDPNSAVGIMEDFFKEYPDFGRGASFYVFYPIPFRQKELIKEKYEFLLNNGYEIGNHGYNHENLGKISMEDVQKSLAKNAINTANYVENFEVFSLALPYGASPKDDNYKYVVSGEYEGYKYNHRAVLKVGSNPAPAPNSTKFDPSRLPRVRASEMNTGGTGIYDWLNHFDKKPNERYISDGNPDTITIPISEEENIDINKLGEKKLIKY